MRLSTSRRRPRRAGASRRPPASPSGTARARPGRPGPREAQGRGRRRIPGFVSILQVNWECGVSHQSLVADEFPGEPEERLLEVVVGLGRDVVVLQVLLAVEGDGLCLDLALLDVDLVAGEDDGDVLADTDQVTWEC
jgi:hypothetical protein